MLSIGSRVRREREARGWTQEDLAARTGISATNISRLENGRVAAPTYQTLSRIAEAFDAELAFKPRTRNVTYADASRQGAKARERVLATGLGFSKPEDRLTYKAARGTDVSSEAALLERLGRE